MVTKLLLPAALMLVGCQTIDAVQDPVPGEGIRVDVFYNHSLAIGDHVMLAPFAFAEEDVRTSSGKSVRVYTVFASPGTHYESLVARLGNGLWPEVVILQSMEDLRDRPGLKKRLGQAQNLCAPDAECPTFIPDWVSGEKHEAAERVVEWVRGQVEKARTEPPIQATSASEWILLNVFLDSEVPIGHSIRDLALAFSGERTSAGREVFTAPLIPSRASRERLIGLLGRPKFRLQVVILRSRQGIAQNPDLQAALVEGENLCAPDECFAFIPNWVSDEEREAAGLFLEFLRRRLAGEEE